jgi:hypothetical protein
MGNSKTSPSLGDWVKNTAGFVATLPVVEFPFQALPQIYAPERTVLKLGESIRAHPYLWCYLRRRTEKSATAFDRASLSAARVTALPAALERLSKWCRFDNTRPASVLDLFIGLSYFLSWTDEAEREGCFEHVLRDPDLALQALKGYHSYLRTRLQAHQVTHGTAAKLDRFAIACLSEIHGRNYKDLIEPLYFRKRGGTAAPTDGDVQAFVSTLQALFDSAAALVLRDPFDAAAHVPEPRVLRVSATDDLRTVTLPASYSDARLMELSCVAFAGLALADSGANLAVLRAYEEPEDLEQQLAQPERINLTHKAIKFRAGGKLVPVTMTVTTMTRLRTYLQVRQRLVRHLGCPDIAPMFGQGAYPGVRFETAKPESVRALDAVFLTTCARRSQRSVHPCRSSRCGNCARTSSNTWYATRSWRWRPQSWGIAWPRPSRPTARPRKAFVGPSWGSSSVRCKEQFWRPVAAFPGLLAPKPSLLGLAPSTASQDRRSRRRSCSRTAAGSRDASSVRTTGAPVKSPRFVAAPFDRGRAASARSVTIRSP